MTGKREIRATMRAQRAAMDRIRKNEADRQIAMNLDQLLSAEHPRITLGYLANATEVETRTILGHLAAEGSRVLVPPPKATIQQLQCFHLITPDDPLLQRGSVPLLPPITCDLQLLREIDLSLVPALAVDSSGTRIGYGGGYFDRLLAVTHVHNVKVALVYDFQVLEDLSRESRDIPMDWIVTEKRVIRCEHG